jgi:hypothetical protein
MGEMTDRRFPAALAHRRFTPIRRVIEWTMINNLWNSSVQGWKYPP